MLDSFTFVLVPNPKYLKLNMKRERKKINEKQIYFHFCLYLCHKQYKYTWLLVYLRKVSDPMNSSDSEDEEKDDKTN